LIVLSLLSFVYIYAIIVITAISDKHNNALRVCTKQSLHFQQVLHEINRGKVSGDKNVIIVDLDNNKSSEGNFSSVTNNM
jgi:hypothetical protein